MFRSRLGLTAAADVLTVLAAQARAERGDKEPPDLRELTGMQHLNDVAFTPDGKTVAVVIANDPLLFLDTATGKDKEP